MLLQTLKIEECTTNRFEVLSSYDKKKPELISKITSRVLSMEFIPLVPPSLKPFWATWFMSGQFRPQNGRMRLFLNKRKGGKGGRVGESEEE